MDLKMSVSRYELGHTKRRTTHNGALRTVQFIRHENTRMIVLWQAAFTCFAVVQRPPLEPPTHADAR